MIEFPSLAVRESSPLEDEVRTFCSLVEVTMLDPSPNVRSIFQAHLRERYPCVARLFSRDGRIYAGIRNAGEIYAVPVMPIPATYLGERPYPVDIDLAALLQ